MKAGIGFATGRKGFKNLIRTYINNWNEHGLIEDRSKELRIIVAYDLKYQNTQASDYTDLSKELLSRIEGIDFYGEKRIEDEKATLVKEGVLSKREAGLLFGDGYGKKRNAVVYAAVRKGMDALVFLDDDEYPLAVMDKPGLQWSGQGVVSTHLEHIMDADITHGRHCGYISPIPFVNYDSVLTEEKFRDFIDALSNDIVNWESIKYTMEVNKGVTYADPSVMEARSTPEVTEIGGMKFISGANLCINLTKPDKLRPFYNPPGARGEDTFLSTCLSDCKVLKMPCYTFHDGFSYYKNLLHGVLPRELQAVTADERVNVTRFAKAAVGWVRYKPLLTYITNRAEFAATVRAMKRVFEATIPSICEYFGSADFKQIPDELDYFARNAPGHYDDFERTKDAWRKAIAWAFRHREG